LIPERYSEILKASGRSLQDMHVAEVALTRPHALDAVTSLKGTQVVILGGDVLRLSNESPRYTGDNWFVKRQPDEDLAAYIVRSHEKAEAYIRNYSQDFEDGSVLYAIVVRDLAQ
jgi:hypothetical protein